MARLTTSAFSGSDADADGQHQQGGVQRIGHGPLEAVDGTVDVRRGSEVTPLGVAAVAKHIRRVTRPTWFRGAFNCGSGINRPVERKFNQCGAGGDGVLDRCQLEWL